MVRGLLVPLMALTLAFTWCAEAAGPQAPILSGPLAKLDNKPAHIEGRGTPKGTLTVAMHFALDPGWLDPLEHSYAITMQKYDYLGHAAMTRPMPYGEAAYRSAG